MSLYRLDARSGATPTPGEPVIRRHAGGRSDPGDGVGDGCFRRPHSRESRTDEQKAALAFAGP